MQSRFSLSGDGTVNSKVALPRLTVLEGVSKFSLSLWAKFTANGSSLGALFSYGGATGGSNGDILLGYVPDTVFVQVNNGADGSAIAPAAAYATGTWAHFAVVYDGTLSGNANRLKMFIAGEAVVLDFSGFATVPATTATNSDNAAMLMNYFLVTTFGLNGKIDDVALFSDALTAAQVAKLAAGRLRPSDVGSLAGWWVHADEGGTGTTADSSGNAHTGTLGSGVAWSTDVPPVLAKSFGSLVPYDTGAIAVVYDHTAREAIDDHWSDGTVNRLYRGSGVWWTISNTPEASAPYHRIGKLVGTFDDPAATSKSLVTIGSVPGGYSYCGGGPVFISPVNGDLILFTHQEKWPGGNLAYFYSSVGLARSTDNGATWTYLGEIIRKEMQYDVGRTAPEDIGAGQVVRVGAYLYCYYQETPAANDPDTNYDYQYVSVARVLAATFFTDAASGAVTAWSKWDGSGWTGNALTGLGASLPGLGAGGGVNNYKSFVGDVFVHSATGMIVMTLLGSDTPDVITNANGMQITTSKDGIHWTEPEIVLIDQYLMLYPGIAFPGATYDRSGQGSPVVITWYSGIVWSNWVFKKVPLTLRVGGRQAGGKRVLGGPSAAVVR